MRQIKRDSRKHKGFRKIKREMEARNLAILNYRRYQFPRYSQTLGRNGKWTWTNIPHMEKCKIIEQNRLYVAISKPCPQYLFLQEQRI